MGNKKHLKHVDVLLITQNCFKILTLLSQCPTSKESQHIYMNKQEFY